MDTKTIEPYFCNQEEQVFYVFFMTSSYTSSPMNYMGSKLRLLPQIIPLLPKGIGTFVDLFCGSCTVGLNVNAEKVVFNDNLVYIIDFYKALKKLSLEQVVSHIEKRIAEYNLSSVNKEGYIAMRQYYNKYRNPLDLFVLLSFCFSNQIRFNNKHEFNQSFGERHSYFNSHQKENLVEFVKALKSKNAEFSASNFDDLDLASLDSGDFVYCDPPYLITTASYNDGKRGSTGWDESFEIKLYNVLDRLNSRSVRFALSNVLEHKGRKNLLLSKWLGERDYKVHNLAMKYSIKKSKEKLPETTEEVLITNY